MLGSRFEPPRRGEGSNNQAPVRSGSFNRAEWVRGGREEENPVGFLIAWAGFYALMRAAIRITHGWFLTIMTSPTFTGILVGTGLWFVLRYGLTCLYTVDQNERAVKTSFGRAHRIGQMTTLDDPISESLNVDQRQRYKFPQVEVIPPGGPYFRWPWQKIWKASVATETVNMAWDPENPVANRKGTILEAVTKDQLNTGLTGQIRFRVAERNLYAYFFGVKWPIAHVMGYFVSVLRERIANFEAPPDPAGAKPNATIDSIPASATVDGISINDIRKNLRDLNEHMDNECLSSAARYGMVLDASLITGIDPPSEVDSALAAINTAYNQVSSDISLAQAAADQKIVQSRRAVEIETLKAEAEVEPLRRLATQLVGLKAKGIHALQAYVRNVRLALFDRATQAILEVQK
jgi:regulator of protease activity HflC (stomatin/prohibitin superfamily)